MIVLLFETIEVLDPTCLWNKFEPRAKEKGHHIENEFVNAGNTSDEGLKLNDLAFMDVLNLIVAIDQPRYSVLFELFFVFWHVNEVPVVQLDWGESVSFIVLRIPLILAPESVLHKSEPEITLDPGFKLNGLELHVVFSNQFVKAFQSWLLIEGKGLQLLVVKPIVNFFVWSTLAIIWI